ncbi:MAG TPA: HAD family phosphatase [Nitrospirota bacterium]|nr:HAD family phosphatase [Nitrospirota bacterium]
MIKTILFDFGGVLAEEGFREGLEEIARKNGVDPVTFFSLADALIDETGYLIGRAGEAEYWKSVRERAGVRGTDHELREEILKRFVLRQPMLACVDLLRSCGLSVAMLSDQTNWLEEIDRDSGLFSHFDRVFNSFRIHRSKREASTFQYVCSELGVKPEEILFIDDNKEHIGRARGIGMQTILFTTAEDFERQIRELMDCRCTP